MTDNPKPGSWLGNGQLTRPEDETHVLRSHRQLRDLVKIVEDTDLQQPGGIILWIPIANAEGVVQGYAAVNADAVTAWDTGSAAFDDSNPPAVILAALSGGILNLEMAQEATYPGFEDKPSP